MTKKALIQITTWMEQHLPEALENLRPAASEQQIAETEALLGLQFPAPLKRLYLTYDGEIHNSPPGIFDDGHWFLPLSEVVSHRNTMSCFAEHKPIDSFESWKSDVEDEVISISGPVKPHMFSFMWIPLTTSNGDVHRYIDLDPAPGGTVGQVIEHYPEACSHQVLASSLDEFLRQYADGLESGRYRIEDSCILAGFETEDESFSMPAYLQDIVYDVVTASDITGAEDLKYMQKGDSLEVVGEVSYLLGAGDEIAFSLKIAGGMEISLLASAQNTSGFGAINMQQFARVTIAKNTSSYTLDGVPGAEVPQYLATHFKMVKGPGINLNKRSWWKFW